MKAQVKPDIGTPTLFLDDKPVFANIHWIGGRDSCPGLAAIGKVSVANGKGLFSEGIFKILAAVNIFHMRKP